MTERVVHVFEVVEVDEIDGGSRPRRWVAQQVIESIEQHPPVAESRQIVVGGAISQHRLDGLAIVDAAGVDNDRPHLRALRAAS